MHHNPPSRTTVALLTAAATLLGADVALRVTAPGTDAGPQGVVAVAQAQDSGTPFNASAQRRAIANEIKELRAEVVGLRSDLSEGITVKVEKTDE
ncbi:MAG: hypothetical protein AAF288_07700 [Planctomycetota bacterium]